MVGEGTGQIRHSFGQPAGQRSNENSWGWRARGGGRGGRKLLLYCTAPRATPDPHQTGNATSPSLHMLIFYTTRPCTVVVSLLNSTGRRGGR